MILKSKYLVLIAFLNVFCGSTSLAAQNSDSNFVPSRCEKEVDDFKNQLIREAYNNVQYIEGPTLANATVKISSLRNGDTVCLFDRNELPIREKALGTFNFTRKLSSREIKQYQKEKWKSKKGLIPEPIYYSIGTIGYKNNSCTNFFKINPIYVSLQQGEELNMQTVSEQLPKELAKYHSITYNNNLMPVLQSVQPAELDKNFTFCKFVDTTIKGASDNFGYVILKGESSNFFIHLVGAREMKYITTRQGKEISKKNHESLKHYSEFVGANLTNKEVFRYRKGTHLLDKEIFHYSDTDFISSCVVKNIYTDDEIREGRFYIECHNGERLEFNENVFISTEEHNNLIEQVDRIKRMTKDCPRLTIELIDPEKELELYPSTSSTKPSKKIIFEKITLLEIVDFKWSKVKFAQGTYYIKNSNLMCYGPKFKPEAIIKNEYYEFRDHRNTQALLEIRSKGYPILTLKKSHDKLELAENFWTAYGSRRSTRSISLAESVFLIDIKRDYANKNEFYVKAVSDGAEGKFSAYDFEQSDQFIAIVKNLKSQREKEEAAKLALRNKEQRQRELSKKKKATSKYSSGTSDAMVYYEMEKMLNKYHYLSDAEIQSKEIKLAKRLGLSWSELNAAYNRYLSR